MKPVCTVSGGRAFLSPAIESDVRNISSELGCPCPAFDAGVELRFQMSGTVPDAMRVYRNIVLVGQKHLACATALEVYLGCEPDVRKAMPMYGKVPNYHSLLAYMAMGDFVRALAFGFALRSRDVEMVIDMITAVGSPLAAHIKATNPMLAYELGCIRATRSAWSNPLDVGGVLDNERIVGSVTTSLCGYKPYYVNGLLLINDHEILRNGDDVFEFLDGGEIARLYEVCAVGASLCPTPSSHPRSDSLSFKLSSTGSPTIRASWSGGHRDWEGYLKYIEPTPDVYHELYWWLMVADVKVYGALSDADYRVVANCILSQCSGDYRKQVVAYGWSDEWFHNLLRRYGTYRRIQLSDVTSSIAEAVCDKVGMRMVFRMAGFFATEASNSINPIMGRLATFKYMYHPMSVLAPSVVRGPNLTLSPDKFDTRLPFRISRSTRVTTSRINKCSFELCYGFSYDLLWKAVMLRQWQGRYTVLMCMTDVNLQGSFVPICGPFIPTVAVLDDHNMDWIGGERLLIWFAERFVIYDKGDHIRIEKRTKVVDDAKRSVMMRMCQVFGINGCWF